MVDPLKFIGLLFETFDKGAIKDFRAFLHRNSEVSKWFITADFCLRDSEKPNNVYAFTIVPFDAYIPNIRSEIAHALPKDWKRTRDITDRAIEFLSDNRRFHIAFVLPKDPEVFQAEGYSTPLEVARASIAEGLKHFEKQGRAKESIDRVKQLQQASLAKKFNVKLLADLFLLSHFFTFVTVLLGRERRIETVGWLPDRDKMTEWCEGVFFVYGVENLLGVAEHYNVFIPEKGPLIAIPTPAPRESGDETSHGEEEGTTQLGEIEPENEMWFDEFVRLPDYIAGIFSSWDFTDNLIPGEKEKYKAMAGRFAAMAKNTALINVRYDTLVQTGRIVFSPGPFS